MLRAHGVLLMESGVSPKVFGNSLAGGFESMFAAYASQCSLRLIEIQVEGPQPAVRLLWSQTLPRSWVLSSMFCGSNFVFACLIVSK